ncbi:hypothetical protein PJP10_09160 [Mycobacterium kansasii]
MDPDKAGRRHATLAVFDPSALTEASHDLNRNVFASLRADPVCGGSWSASRSFVLAALRALHLDPDCGPPPLNTERGARAKQQRPTRIHLYGGPQHR